jgi:predicted Holliday junction resolvase-like endonuclease
LKSRLIDILSVFVPLFALLLLTIALLWYAWYRIRRLRQRISLESGEVHEMVAQEFANLRELVDDQSGRLEASRKTKKMTKAETAMVSALHESLATAEQKIMKEVRDVEDLTPDHNHENNST